MAKNKGETLKAERTPDEIQDLEDRFSDLAGIFRAIRKKMAEQPPARPRLKLGTVQHHLAECETFASKVEKEYELEVKQEAQRERLRQRLADAEKKRK